ncbi:ABC transporter ATP-binding protein [uncultured Anaerococcus sp.]|uniref:ABC transporter ATP-binding protein n=1 Tax=uncultured Anaerococcus sp. TaxID=293428 RepID=UPI00261D997B|nr:ABC transporter ATP-binding protein [uncultured Anaerococcus sp.]
MNNIELYIDGNIKYIYVIRSFFGLMLAIVANPIVNSINTSLSSDFEERVNGHIEKNFNQKCSNLDSIFFESRDNLLSMEKASQGLSSIVSLVTGIVLGIFTYFPYFISLTIYFYNINPTLIAVLFVFFIGPVLSQMFKKKLYQSLEDNISPLRRESNHYKDCMIGNIRVRETRMLGAFTFFMQKYRASLLALNKNIYYTQKKSARIETIFKLPLILSNILSLMLLVDYLIKGLITIGNFGAIIASINMLIMMAEEFIFYVIGSAIKQIAFVENFIDFMEKEIIINRQLIFKKAPAIELENVSFAYPESNKNSLTYINFKIKAGETVAIVGENGSGKSTLAKIISGLYQPTRGRIIYDNIDIKDCNFDIASNISIVFQDFSRYKINLEENIRISDYNKKTCLDDLVTHLEFSNLSLNKNIFPDGLATMLSRQFNGVELSGGQWQKLAIARASFKDSNLIIFDEPTSAIDSIEEEKLFNNFLELSISKTAIIISHKLAMTRFVDKIIVMKDGKVEEIGNHDELIKRNGLYKKLYLTQSVPYLNN